MMGIHEAAKILATIRRSADREGSTRYDIDCVYVEKNTAYATDGKRLVSAPFVVFDVEDSDHVPILIPGYVLNWISAVDRKTARYTELRVAVPNANEVAFTVGYDTISYRHNGKFPRVAEIIRDVDRQTLDCCALRYETGREARRDLRSAAIVRDDDGVRFEYVDLEKLEATGADKCRICLQYLMEAIPHTADDVSIRWRDKDSAAYVRAGDFRSAIMPLNQ